MMPVFHADTSAVARMRQPPIGRRLTALSGEGRLARSRLVDLEFLRYAPGRAADPMRHQLDAMMLRASLTQADLDRAIEVQVELTVRGQHHGTPAVDLVIAAVAERAGATLLHYDADFERIAEITGQSVEWVVPRGEADGPPPVRTAS